jgi:pyridinium-3,5-bisthiocarboxylic acid mononucleotide nickel chelatase
MKTLYLDIFSGISGDMFLGALIDLGVDPHALEHELEKLGVAGEYHLHTARQSKAHIMGVKFDVHGPHEHHHHHDEPHGHGHTHTHSHEHSHGSVTHTHEHGHEHSHGHGHGTAASGSTHSHDHHDDEHGHGHSHEHHGHDHVHGRNYADIKTLIQDSALSSWVKEKAVAVFHRIAVAEGKVHGMPAEEVHFHEVGAIDSIVDIVGACIALEMLGKPRVLAAPVVEGTGWIHCAHGRFPIPAPATLNILGARGVAVTQCDEPHELVTPTGAALLAEFVAEFGPMRRLVAEKIGFGLGTRDHHTRPNVLRAVLGKETGDRRQETQALDWETDAVAVLETNLDDISAELLGHFVERALAAGALDVFHTPVQMKKNRPGVLLTVLCAEAEADKFAELILRETTAFGVRRTTAERRKLQRETVTVKTPHGPVAVKLGKLSGKVVQVAPEFESCKAAADKADVPVKEAIESARRAALQD